MIIKMKSWTIGIVNITMFLSWMFIEGFGYTMQVDLDTVHSITETALTIRGSRRRITVPAEIVEQLELKDGDKLRWIAFKDKSIYVQKVQ